MDCEKFEPLLLDELYDELDEVTSAAVKRHVSGCARCGPILEGMRSTRRLAVLPMLELPDGLEDRILASVKNAEKEGGSQKVVPLFSGVAAPADAVESARSRGPSAQGEQSTAARALSWAGSWAMRPQTAMAAVFLLMIGTSAFVIRSRHSSERAASVSVTEQGEPAAAAPGGPDEHDSLDSKAAAAAHGANQPAPITAPPAATVASGASQTSAVASAAGALALGGPADPNANAGFVDGLTAGKGRGAAKEDTTAIGNALSASDGKNEQDKDSEERQRRAEKKTATRAAAAPAPPSEITNAGVPGGAPYAAGAAQDYAPRGQSVAAPLSKSAGSDPQDGFSAGMAAYRSRNFAEATRQFDSASRTGDQNAALWAAKSVKDGNGGCGVALPRFDAIAQRSAGTWIGNEATLESARCQIAMGQLDAARDKLAKLTNVPSHAAPAQQALNELNQVATKREADRAKSGASGGGYARPAAAAPARAPAKPAATASKPADDASNKASGY